MLKKIKKGIKHAFLFAGQEKLLRYLIWVFAIDGFDGCLCIADEFFGKEKKREISIKGIKLRVRTNTPDVGVAVSSLFFKEYDKIRCSNPNLIVDAGANIGTSALFFAKKYPMATVLAVEPEKSNFEMLIANTRKQENIVAVKAAIWGASEKRVIKDRSQGHWGYTVADTQNEVDVMGQEVECITIPCLMKKYGFDKIDFLKMDIEGGEKNVLEQSANWIDSVDVMAVELHDRICAGCENAFEFATKRFKTFEMHGEKVTAYRN